MGHQTYLQKRSPTFILMSKLNNASMLVLCLKCSTLLGTSDEQPKMVLAGQGGQEVRFL
jgi:hypothetical protein